MKPLILFAAIVFCATPVLAAADCPRRAQDADGNCPTDSSGLHSSVEFSIGTGAGRQTPTHGSYYRNPRAMTTCPDGSYVSGTCRMQPDGSYAGDRDFGDPN